MPAFAIHQRTDDIAQGCQGQVNLDALLEPVACTAYNIEVVEAIMQSWQ
jgi:hypothetical protein